MKPYRPAKAGEANHQAKLNRHEAREVREAARRGTPPEQLSRAYGVGVRHVYKLKLAERWLDLD